MGASAAESAAYDALKRGATQNQAMAVGFWTGLTEVIFEKISLDELFGAGSPTKRRAIIQKALRQSKVEATEELCTEIANRFTDNMLMQEKSQYNQRIAYYVNAEGLSESEAVWHARRDMILDLGAAALGGGLSGFAMGSAKGLVDRYSGVGSVSNSAQTGELTAPSILSNYNIAPQGVELSVADDPVVQNQAYEQERVSLDEIHNEPDKDLVPAKAYDVAKQIEEHNGAAPSGYKGGRIYHNTPMEDAGQKLPANVSYREYDINPYVKGQNRGGERIVVGSDGSVWYTNDHYFTFIRIK